MIFHEALLPKSTMVTNCHFRYEGFPQSEEASLIQQLLQAYDEQDDTTAYECIHNPAFKYMENEVIIMQRIKLVL